MTDFNQAKMLFDIADAEAKKLQVEKGREPKGIRSTQVKGLIVALGTMFDKLVDIAEQRAIKNITDRNILLEKVCQGVFRGLNVTDVALQSKLIPIIEQSVDNQLPLDTIIEKVREEISRIYPLK